MRTMVCPLLIGLLGVPSNLVTAEPTPAARVALVIGNSKYDPVLRNPSNDADAVEAAIKDLGFAVSKEKDLDRRGLRDALVAFRRKLTKGSLGLFYYAGHGIQVKGENYLVPIGAQMREEFEAREECINVSQVLEAMAEAEVNLKVLVLDCCRDNPLQRTWKRSSFGKGLAGMQDVPVGTLIAFSTSPNQTAADGTGNNSPYTEQLVSTLRSRPADGLELSELFREASRAVKAKTGQVPWLNQEASLERYYLWKTESPQRSRNPTMPPPPEQIEVAFRVRDGSYEGPELQGVEAQLRHRVDQTATPTVVGLGITDAKGLTRIKVPADATRQPGSFEVVLSAGGSSVTLPLKEFPRSLQWTLWLPRSRTSATAGRERFITNSIGMRLAMIPPGEFWMGSPESEKDRFANEGPQHWVRITKPFYLGQYEVTQAEYQRVMGENPSYYSPTGSGRAKVFRQDTSHFPVEEVSWDDAVTFCRRLSQKEGKTYRLPTEAEWEYACRAGTMTPFNFGSVLTGREANCDGNHPYGTNEKINYVGHPTTVGSYRPNAFGLYDMHGNVREWCSDWYEEHYNAQSPVDDPTGPTWGSLRVHRGGCWSYNAVGCRSADRCGGSPDGRLNFLGFRVARAPE